MFILEKFVCSTEEFDEVKIQPSSSPSSSLFSSQLPIGIIQCIIYYNVIVIFIIDRLVDVIDSLKRCGFPENKWHDLGLRLGLLQTTLEAIERNNHCDASLCLIDCLSKWLRRVDNVFSRGGATWDSLSVALRSMNEITVADNLDQESELLSINFSNDNFYRITS